MLSFENPSLFSPIISFEFMIGTYCVCLPSTQPLSGQTFPISLGGTIPDSSTWMTIQWAGRVSRLIRAPPPPAIVIKGCGVLPVGPLRFIPEIFLVRHLEEKVLIHLGLMRRSDTILMNFPLPITADKNKSSVDLVICPFNSIPGAVEATSWHLLRRICFRETYTRN